MGGNKQKTAVGASDKANANTQVSDTKSSKKEDSKKIGSKQQQRQKLSVLVEEPQGLKLLQSMKAITIQSYARSAGVKISVANAFIKSAESKGIVRNVGGYSGHKVYELVKLHVIADFLRLTVVFSNIYIFFNIIISPD
jgi:small subunit ribosomal protein S25e